MNKLLILFTLFSSCFSSDTSERNEGISDKILIIYLSRTKNTKTVAEIIHLEVGGDLVELELKNPYPENYQAIVKQVAEENESGFLPPLKTKVNLDKYDTIFLGFPTWGMQLPPPIKSFLKDYDFTGKTVIPFNTNAGYGVGSSFRQLKTLCEGCKILDGFSTEGGIERDGVYLAIEGDRKKEVATQIIDWLSEIKMRAHQ